ncbi:MAG: tRNA (adenosine(37)-N6)-threonylcarbamoyltransferase complex dimerization subunit type 1 TsaB [Crocinitomicaceae bacterium]|jgi:tRNA threonylcarbamoyladenosine biosynthesis protein TsaB
MKHYILHLETSTQVCSVALSLNGELIALKDITDKGFVHGEMITLLIEEVLKQVDVSITELSAVSVASGPGSYTGLRIGVSTAKGLCYALNIPLIAIDSLKCLEQVARMNYYKETIVSMIDARRMEVFSAIYNSEGEVVKTISADILDEQSYEAFLPFTVVGDAVGKVKSIWENRAIRFDESCIASAKGQVRIGYEKFQKQEFEDVAYFEPFYLKDFVTGVSTKNALNNG